MDKVRLNATGTFRRLSHFFKAAIGSDETHVRFEPILTDAALPMNVGSTGVDATETQLVSNVEFECALMQATPFSSLAAVI